METMDGILPSDGFDPFDLNRPHARWEQFRKEEPIFYHEPSGYWVVSRFDDIKAIFDDWKTFSSENAQKPMRPMSEAGRQILKEGGFTAYSGLTARVPPDHTRIRKVAQSCFGPRRFKSIEPQIEEIVKTHLDKLEAAGRDGKPVDFWDIVAYPVPAHVLFTLMGIPDRDVPKIKQYGASRGKMTWSDLSDEEMIPVAHDMVAYWQYIHDLLDMRRDAPGDDFPSDLLRLQAEGADISNEEIAGVLYSTLFAGHETTSTFMGNYVIAMMQNPEAWDAIKADPSLIPNAVEEMLRYMPSVVGWRRKARTEAVVGGVRLPAGAEVLMITGSANRDESQFPDGEKLDITRQNARTHLSFGYGIHYCLGFQLAKMEGAVLLRQLSERFPDLCLAPGFEAEYHRNITFRVPTSVMVQLGGAA
ncbi:cytochrome P450 [Pararhodobacter marinus]|uniref:Cytochrome P450 n=1 Tax=Pararhodobacter marinus TaxID=2184063 RepID=A0A2U2C7N5_9RHOB|nr:cytochrome P450 [Pararhodobacter marinus]PWE27873.1 cytochrome P450 [Pararhodobacter marinus]